MNLVDIVQRNRHPEPWSEAETIPWNDPAFSERMLQEHLSQSHDAASRRFDIIDQHVRWLHEEVLHGKVGKILDLGCGPGLYSSRLARLGHTCVGIDFSPASIRYAKETAQKGGLSCTFREEDIRQADYGDGFNLVMLIYGEFNIFRPSDAALLLAKAFQALLPGGSLVLEPHTYEIVVEVGKLEPNWFSSNGGLFSDRPHLVLNESIWDDERQAAMERHYVIDAESGVVNRLGRSVQAYTDDDYRSLLTKNGFREIEFFSSLSGKREETRGGLMAILGRK